MREQEKKKKKKIGGGRKIENIMYIMNAGVPIRIEIVTSVRILEKYE